MLVFYIYSLVWGKCMFLDKLNPVRFAVGVQYSTSIFSIPFVHPLTLVYYTLKGLLYLSVCIGMHGWLHQQITCSLQWWKSRKRILPLHATTWFSSIIRGSNTIQTNCSFTIVSFSHQGVLVVVGYVSALWQCNLNIPMQLSGWDISFL